jgi:Holliday junction resolvase RusA-like endonuclease
MWGQAGKRKFLKKAAHEFRAKVQDAVVEAKAKFIGERAAVFVALYPPTKRKYDADNRLKCLLDALQHTGVIYDDEIVDTIVVVKREVVAGGMCKVVIVSDECRKVKQELWEEL